MLFIGEKVGMNAGPQVDIAVDPLEGTTLCAKNMPVRSRPWPWPMRHAAPCPDVYMQKIAVRSGYAKGVVELDASPADNVRRLARRRVSRLPRSPCWCSIVRVTPTLSPACAAQVLRYA